jgi:hypothetical protein
MAMTDEEKKVQIESLARGQQRDEAHRGLRRLGLGFMPGRSLT